MTDTRLVRPIVLVPADNRMLGEHPFHVVGKKYVDAVRLAGCLPLVVPWVGASEVDELLVHADGVLLTGSPSNVHPSHFGEEVHNPELPLDPARDEWTLPLTRKALAQGVPMLAICRGFQETNVALGGTLHQAGIGSGVVGFCRTGGPAPAGMGGPVPGGLAPVAHL